jgi:hypothetical protein
MQTFKAFVFIYAIFTLILLAVGQNTGMAIFPELITPTSYNLTSLIEFGISLLQFITALLFYSTPYFILNVILWSYRIVCLFELAEYLKDLANPLH